jgi:hypothetical protein
MKISRKLKKFLNPRILHLLEEDKIPKITNIKVGCDKYTAYWAHRTRAGKWVLRSGRKFPANVVTPKELDVDWGYTSISLSGIIPPHGTVGGMM